MKVEQWLNTTKNRYVVLTMFLAWVISQVNFRQYIWMDWVAFILLFWTLYRPTMVPLWLGFAIGIVVDIQQSSNNLGEHALMYVWMIYIMRLLAPRLHYAAVFIHALFATFILLVASFTRAILYAVFAGQTTSWLEILWIFMVVPVWLCLAWLLTLSGQPKKGTGWADS